ncbi:hypothetical protein FNO01nite_26460 [Flavobacterium noncentrifugens]|uniref:Por secretion system C-terminal sorting domain-containing protein n=1 Tax=Flavobacterium noncentrifugens TaxID=1128970 RepID=A0A1G8ZEB2_9FLAO|nr:T9SS type A sorting domain-containing protein [Flavobacterium noncentrifugens]GEP51974.1 hypothetical protein FNO01nite_26460 [Flavobacterium noncentrifugens]SDK13367.1 Por secretion system C-terminal sorting domain-containing protein [Flavobacterium noncentrifugens]
MKQKSQNRLPNFFTVLLMLAILPLSAQSIIFKNNIEGTNPSQFNPFTEGQETDAHVTATGIGRGAGLVSATESGSYSVTSWNTSAVDNTAYFEFTVTPNPGYRINYGTLEFNIGFSGGPNNAPLAVRTNLSSYATNIPFSRASFSVPVVIDLSASAYQQVNSSMTFRIYPYGSANISDRFTIYDFAFKGSVAPLCNLGLPEGNSQQLFQPGSTLADLEVAGTNLSWFASMADALDGSPVLPIATALTDGATYYVTQSNGGCTSAPLPVTVAANLATAGFDQMKFLWYPNPVSDQLQIEALSEIDHVVLFALSGQQLGIIPGNGNKAAVDFSNLAPGIYLVKVFTKDGFKTFKVSKAQ